MVQEEPAIAQHVPDGPEVGRKIFLTDMLNHADTCNFIERAFTELFWGIPIVELEYPDAWLKACGPDPFLGERKLVLRQGNADGVDAVVLRRIQNEPTPATADVE